MTTDKLAQLHESIKLMSLAEFEVFLTSEHLALFTTMLQVQYNKMEYK